jgi:hypothetical protein
MEATSFLFGSTAVSVPSLENDLLTSIDALQSNSPLNKVRPLRRYKCVVSVNTSLSAGNVPKVKRRANIDGFARVEIL